MTIGQMLLGGFSVSQIIDFLSSQFPNIAGRIQMAKKAGKSSEEIFDFLKGLNKDNLKKLNSELTPYQPEGNSTIAGREAAQTLPGVHPALKTIGKGIAIGAGAAAIPALSRSLPTAAQKLLGIPGAEGGAAATGAIPPVVTPAATVATAAQAIQPGQGASIIQQLGDKVSGVIKNLAGKEAPEVIASVLEQHILSPGQKKWLADQGVKDLPGLIQDFLQNNASPQAPSQNQAQDAISAGVKNTRPLTTNVEAQPLARGASQQTSDNQDVAKNLSKPLESGSAALLPSGDIGQVQSVKNGIAKLNVNGKERYVKADEIIESPLPEKDLADLYDQLVSKIPESDRSAMINVAGYDPEHNELLFFPHGPGSALYVYKDIPKAFADKLKEAMFQAKTTGQNFYGAWSQGESSRGAGMSALIKELQKEYGGKGKEYIRKYQNVYDYFGPAKQAVKEKEKRQREEKRSAQGKAPRKRKKPGNG